MVVRTQSDLWNLVLEQHEISPLELGHALCDAINHPPLDFRTRLLIRDGLDALEKTWGSDRLTEWMNEVPEGARLRAVRAGVEGPAGFASLGDRLMEPTRADTVLRFLRELGQSLKSPAQITIGGSIALMLPGTLSRRTEDIDVVDEVPFEVRSEHALLDALAKRYDLRLTHFQSHFLPTGWEGRVRPLGTFDRLEVKLIDPYDIIAGKVFSGREKDRDDLRFVSSHIDKQILVDRLRSSAATLRGEPRLREQGEKNWYVVFGEPLPG